MATGLPVQAKRSRCLAAVAYPFPVEGQFRRPQPHQWHPALRPR